MRGSVIELVKLTPLGVDDLEPIDVSHAFDSENDERG